MYETLQSSWKIVVALVAGVALGYGGRWWQTKPRCRKQREETEE